MDKDDENQKKHMAEEKSNIESNVALFNLSSSVCEPVIGGNVLDVAKMSDNDDETPAIKKRKIRIKKCRMCGKTTGKIVSNACPDHLDEMRKRNAAQKSLNNKKNLGYMVSNNPFKVRINAEYNKVLSYYADILLPATFHQGRYVEMSKKGLHLSLKNNGVGFVKNGFPVTESKYTEFKKMVNDKSWKYQTLMTSYTVDGTRKFLSGKPNRWIIYDTPTMVKVQDWNDLEMSLIAMLVEHKFPKDQFEYEMHFQVMKSDPKLMIAQHPHCDSANSYTYGKSKTFLFSMLIGIEESSFLDVSIQGEKGPHRVVYNRGDVIFIRNDIPHRGCENIGDYEHHRVHVFTVPKNVRVNADDKTQIPFTAFPMPPSWCDIENKYISYLK